MLDFKEINKDKIVALRSYMEEQEYKKSSLIMILHKAQDIFEGYLPREILEIIAQELKISLSKVNGVVSFYSFFNTKKKGKNVINVCLGTACFVKGAQEVLDGFKNELKISLNETTEDDMFTLESVRCVGTCGLAPVISVNGKVYGGVKKEDVRSILDEYRKNER